MCSFLHVKVSNSLGADDYRPSSRPSLPKLIVPRPSLQMKAVPTVWLLLVARCTPMTSGSDARRAGRRGGPISLAEFRTEARQRVQQRLEGEILNRLLIEEAALQRDPDQNAQFNDQVQMVAELLSRNSGMSDADFRRKVLE